MSSSKHNSMSEAKRFLRDDVWYFLLWAGLMWYSVSRFFPGFPSSLDNQLYHAIDPEVIIDNWHPAFLTWVWRVLSQTLGHYGYIFVWHAAMFWAGLVLMIPGMVRNRVGAAVLIVFIGLGPFGLPYIHVYHKDVPFAAALLLAAGLLIRARERRNVVSCYLAVFFLFVACAVRHNGFVAAFPFCFYAAYVFNEIASSGRVSFLNKRLWVHAFLIFCLIFVCAFFVNQGIARKTSRYPVQMVLLYDLAGTSVNAGTVLVPEAFHRSQDLDYIQDLYTPRIVDTLIFGSRKKLEMTEKKEDMEKLWLAWKNGLRYHALAYFKHRRDHFWELLSGRADPGQSMELEQFSEHIKALHTSGKMGEWEYLFLRWHSRVPGHSIKKPVVYLLIFVLTFFWHARREFKDDPIISVLVFSGLFYLLAYFFLSVSFYFKYTWWSALAMIMSAVYVYSRYVDESKNKKGCNV